MSAVIVPTWTWPFTSAVALASATMVATCACGYAIHCETVESFSDRTPGVIETSLPASSRSTSSVPRLVPY
ncbi:hypothetical protein SRABI128_02645 [Microbacterium sp. Bi128]|nr:hypothetical protein SRABI128_02645 [Microbacterium sp. Bi128]